MELKTVLLVDDNEIDLFVTRKFLEKTGQNVSIYAVNSGIEALEFLKEKKISFPDLIFLDIKMPEMDGFEFLEEFEKLPDTRKDSCKIFMLSSSQDQNDVKKSFLNPFVKNFISKPVSLQILKSIFV